MSEPLQPDSKFLWSAIAAGLLIGSLVLAVLLYASGFAK